MAGLLSLPAEAAELPDRRKMPLAESLRVCSAYGQAFFFIPGTDTCLRLSGRTRFEYAYQPSLSRTGNNAGTTPGDYSGFQGRARINLDARTQTAYGALRSFIRLDTGSRTGFATMHAGALNRIGGAFPATGLDGFGRVQQQLTLDKAFVQFAGLTAGRASSFFDFYAHDFEFVVASLGSDIASTNLAAYTATFGQGFAATLSLEDPSFRHTPVYSAQNAVPRAVVDSGSLVFAQTNPVTPIFVGYDADGRPSGLGFVDTIQRNRMPDMVGVLRYDQPWGSAQLSGALHEVNHGLMDSAGFSGTHRGSPVTLANNRTPRAPSSAIGWAVQGGLKVNLPFIAAGDTLYLQAAYGEGTALYTGLPAYNGPWAQAASAVQGAAFSQFFNDGVINPFTNRLELTTSVSVTAALLHYWTPAVRSAVFGSYGALTFARGAREAQGAFFALTGTGPGTPGTRFFDLSQVLRDSYRFVVGANLIWSPVKEFDIGVEAIYTRYGPSSGRILDLGRFPSQGPAFVNNPANPVATADKVDAIQVRARVQRDF
ncbi:porin [Methylobacterium sp. J-076]|nr:porin [Methylobacterium sp. J-076]MCJ2015187.1 porin [Methylobacterium sp. J-076]